MTTPLTSDYDYRTIYFSRLLNAPIKKRFFCT
nr:MAG TPA: hypothetical protein [Bacteriophage sp.]